MKHRALIVEDDPSIIHLVVDALASIGHEFDTACSQEEAHKRLAEKDHSYILLGIKIPARAHNGIARIQNTENLLEEIAECMGKDAPPVIILSDHEVEGRAATADAMCLALSLGRRGVADIIVKPSPTEGRTLDKVIKKVLGTHNGDAKKGTPHARALAPKADQDGDAADDKSQWLTVTQAAELLMHDVPAVDLAKARSRISTAAGRKEFNFAGVRKDRRIEPHTFASWRLRQRDRDLDEEEDDELG
jgi:CheY-like chemotaxis protein